MRRSYIEWNWTSRKAESFSVPYIILKLRCKSDAKRGVAICVSAIITPPAFPIQGKQLLTISWPRMLSLQKRSSLFLLRNDLQWK